MPHLRGPRASHRRHFESATSAGPRRPRCPRPGSRPARGVPALPEGAGAGSPDFEPVRRGGPECFFGGWGRARCRTGSRAPSFRPPTPQGSSSRRGPRTPSRRSRMLCSLIPVDIPTAATASTALSADSALTAYFGLCHNPSCSLQRFVVISHVIACPAGTRRARRPGPGGRVRPAADGRAGPFRFRKERIAPRWRSPSWRLGLRAPRSRSRSSSLALRATPRRVL